MPLCGMVSFSNQNPIAMVDLMLDDLGCEALKDTRSGMERLILISNGDLPVSFCFSDACQRQTAFLCFVFSRFCGDLRVDHDHLHWTIAEYDDALLLTDHVGGHAYAAVLVGSQGVHQVSDDLTVGFRGWLRLLCQKERIMHDGSFHTAPPGSIVQSSPQIVCHPL